MTSDDQDPRAGGHAGGGMHRFGISGSSEGVFHALTQQAPIGVFVLGQVDARAHPAQQSPARVPHGVGGGFDPGHARVGAQEAVLAS
jgi:hypothetical protein